MKALKKVQHTPYKEQLDIMSNKCVKVKGLTMLGTTNESFTLFLEELIGYLIFPKEEDTPISIEEIKLLKITSQMRTLLNNLGTRLKYKI